MAKYETLVDVYKSATAAFPTRDLFGTKRGGAWTWMTYREFGNQVERVRAGLQGLGLKRGDKLAIVANNRVEWAVVAYAALGLGVAYVPMYEAQHESEWTFIVRDSGAKVAIVATDKIAHTLISLREQMPELGAIVSLSPEVDASRAILSWSDLLAAEPNVPCVDVAAADTACLIYTSGTTGQPKGVILSHGNIASNVAAVHGLMPMGADDRALSFLPWAHVFGQTCELHTLLSLGACMAICESVDKILDNLTETRPTILVSVPRIFNKLYSAVQRQIASKPAPVRELVKAALAARKKLRETGSVSLPEKLLVAVADKLVFSKVRARFGGRLAFAFSGGAALSKEVAEFIDGIGIVVYEGYGLTETSPIAVCNSPSAKRIGSVGKPFPGIRIELTPESEIIVYGPNVMVGYHNRPEENAAVFTEPDASGQRGFRTGDMGRFDADGFLFITGRIKEQYKLENGKYVVPTPLEEKIKLSQYVNNVMVYGDNRPYNVALITVSHEALLAWGKENGRGDLSVAELVRLPDVRAIYEREIAGHSEEFKGFESVKNFALLAEDFSTANEMLTPSLKLKRRRVVEFYGPELSALYTKKA